VQAKSPRKRRGLVYRRLVVTKAISPFSAGTGRGESEEGSMGFALEVGDTERPLGCRHVLGFREAVVAAQDPAAPAPARLVIVAPDPATDDWLARWSEDDTQVRRTLTICRRRDNSKVTAVATIAAYGHGTDTSLAIESVTLPWRRRSIVRSGVHPKAFLEAVLALQRASEPARLLDPNEPSP
jgi:hypothetical protein